MSRSMGGQKRAAIVVRGSFGKVHLSWQICCNSSEAEVLSLLQVHLSVAQFISYWELFACINVVTGEGFELQGRKSVDVWRCC